MNYDPDIILGPQHGNNARVQSLSVVVMNKREPTRAQLDDLAQLFEVHRTAVRNSLAGLVCSHGELADGSLYEIDTNSGMTSIALWPAGGDTLVELVDEFWGIPTNTASTSGTETPPSGRWRVTDEPQMPPALSQQRYLTTTPNHPGHNTWSSPDFKADKEQIVLSWRGPRNRYATTTGWSGSTIVAHELAGTDIGNQVFRDSSYLWLNGRRVLLPVNKIIAAALHCPDPTGAPGMVVLRVATDALNSASVRKLGTLDLVPEGATQAVSLTSLMTAETFAVLTTHSFPDEGPDPTQWRLVQRPHFDKNGERLATVIDFDQAGSSVGPNDSRAVALDAETGAFLEEHVQQLVSVDSGTDEVSDTGAGVNPRTISAQRDRTFDVTSTTYMAVDFLDNELVWIVKQQREVLTTSSTETEATNDSGVIVTDDSEYTVSQEMTVYVDHSVHGRLVTRSYTYGYTGTLAYSGGTTTGSNSAYTIGPTSAIGIVGDLSRDTFAIGRSVNDSRVVSAYSTSSPSGFFSSNGYDAFIKAPYQDSSEPLVFDIWMAGQLRASATQGSFAAEAATAGALQTNHFVTVALVSEGLISKYKDVGAPTPSWNITTTTPASHTPPNWRQHCAVNSRRSVAYLGAYQQTVSILGAPLNRSGLEAACFLDEDGFTLAEVPPYAHSNYPTISAPVFPGVKRKQVAQ